MSKPREANPYDDKEDAVIFKFEDYRQGAIIGPVWVRRGGVMEQKLDKHDKPLWYSLKGAEEIANKEGLPLAQV